MNDGVRCNRWPDAAARGQSGRSISARIVQTWVVTLALCVTGFAVAQDPGFVLQGEAGLVTTLVLDPSAPAMV